jgi:hypothetical protein
VIDRPNIQIDGLDAAERAPHPAQGFVATYCIGGCRLPGNLGGLSGEAEGVVGNRQIEMLFHFVGVEHRTDRERDLRGAARCVTKVEPRLKTIVGRPMDQDPVLRAERSHLLADPSIPVACFNAVAIEHLVAFGRWCSSIHRRCLSSKTGSSASKRTLMASMSITPSG